MVGERRTWFSAYRQVEGSALHPLGLAVLLDHVDPDVTKWQILEIVYNGQMFFEVEDLVERYKVFFTIIILVSVFGLLNNVF